MPFYLSICLSIYLYAFLSIYMPFYLSKHQCFSLSVFIFLCLSKNRNDFATAEHITCRRAKITQFSWGIRYINTMGRGVRGMGGELRLMEIPSIIPQHQCCGSGSGSGRIRNVLPGSGSGIIIPDPDPTYMKTNF